MKWALFLALLLPSVLQGAKLPWMGVVLAKATAEEVAETLLPSGIGLRVVGLSEEGPYQIAGGKEGDLWLKFDDQYLTSKGQLMVLLEMEMLGKRVPLTVMRKGQRMILEIEMVEKPKRAERAEIVRRRQADEEVRSRLLESHVSAKMLSDGQEFLLVTNGLEMTFKVDGAQGGEFLVISNGGPSARVPAQWSEQFSVLQDILAEPRVRARKPRTRYVRRDDLGKGRR